MNTPIARRTALIGIGGVTIGTLAACSAVTAPATTPSGTPSAAATPTTRWPQTSRPTTCSRYPRTRASPSRLYSIVAADIHGDGMIDLLVANFTDGTLSTIAGADVAASGDAAEVSTLETGGSPYDVATADLTGDGLLDLVIVDISGSLEVIAASCRPIAPSVRCGKSFFPASPAHREQRFGAPRRHARARHVCAP